MAIDRAELREFIEGLKEVASREEQGGGYIDMWYSTDLARWLLDLVTMNIHDATGVYVIPPHDMGKYYHMELAGMHKEAHDQAVQDRAQAVIDFLKEEAGR